jgi:hypothetical protein
MLVDQAAKPEAVESPELEPARFFELDAVFPPEVTCPECGEGLDLDGTDGAALTLGDVIDAATEHECTFDDTAYPGPQGEQAEWDLR